ncbi:MAG: ABC transporter permease [Acidobacteriia bacterium]|nr:ABC transporter permease [Terriglobia bacterium]
MLRRLIQRLLISIPLILGITFFSFLLMHTAQGDFLSSMQLNPQIDQRTIQTARSQFGLDRPWYVQYEKWMVQILHGNLGYSFAFQEPVGSMIGSFAENTILLSVTSLGIALLIAFPVGIFSALKRNSWIDRIIQFISTAGMSVPTILVALLALLVASRTQWFPIGGRQQVLISEMSWGENLLDLLHHLALPALVLSINPTILYIRQVRSNVASVLSDPFMTSAQAKGLHPARILWAHALRNALNPIISLFGFSFANLLNGAFLVEIIMSWPGLGRLTFDALLARDLYLVMGSLTLASVMLMGGNLLADLLMAWNDPRIRRASV